MDRPVTIAPRPRSPAELMLQLIENAADGWLHKTKVIERSDMAPGAGATYIDVMIANGWLESYRDGRLMYVRSTPAGIDLLAEGRDFFGRLDKTLDDLTAARR